MKHVCGLFAALVMVCSPLGVFAGPPILIDDTGTPGPALLLYVGLQMRF